MTPCWFQVWLDTAVKKKTYMNIQWWVVMKSKCSVWESVLDWVYLCCAELVDGADREKWETLYALTRLKFCPALLMVCLTADGDVTVCALMKAILFWQSSSDLFVWEDTDEQEDREMTRRSTHTRLHLVALIEGLKIAPSRKAFAFWTHEPFSTCTRFPIIYLRL